MAMLVLSHEEQLSLRSTPRRALGRAAAVLLLVLSVAGCRQSVTGETTGATSAEAVVAETAPAAAAVGGDCVMKEADGRSVVASAAGMPTGADGWYVCLARVESRGDKFVTLDHATTGQLCQTPLGPTSKWQERIGPDGTAVLSCRVGS
jgi:hypothetical protein